MEHTQEEDLIRREINEMPGYLKTVTENYKPTIARHSHRFGQPLNADYLNKWCSDGRRSPMEASLQFMVSCYRTKRDLGEMVFSPFAKVRELALGTVFPSDTIENSFVGLNGRWAKFTQLIFTRNLKEAGMMAQRILVDLRLFIYRMEEEMAV